MSVEEIHSLFDHLWQDMPDFELQKRKPLLAHYTPISTLEKILANDEIWFSNPLLMNDLEELLFGIELGVRGFMTSRTIRKACHREEQYQILQQSFQKYYEDLDYKDAFDIYALCFSEHDPDHNDSLLSMWRGYGSNGKRAALVFDSSTIPVVKTSPLAFDKVRYDTVERTPRWLDDKSSQFANILDTSQIRDDHLYIAAHSVFERIKMFALFTKHAGFTASVWSLWDASKSLCFHCIRL